MATAKKKAAPKKSAASNDIEIVMAFNTCDGEEHVREVTISNARGCIRSDKINNADDIMEGIVTSLKNTYGRGHIRT